MDIDYNSVRSVDEENFWNKVPSDKELSDPNKFTLSDPEDILKIERVLDLREGVFANEKFYVETVKCKCGRLLTMYDFVVSGLIDTEHTKSFILHVLMGNKFVLNPARRIRCAECGTITPQHHIYYCNSYACNYQQR